MATGTAVVGGTGIVFIEAGGQATAAGYSVILMGTGGVMGAVADIQKYGAPGPHAIGGSVIGACVGYLWGLIPKEIEPYDPPGPGDTVPFVPR